MIRLIFFITFYLLLLPITVNAESFKIGMILPLTGPLASAGVALKNSIELAQEELSKEARDKIKFVYENSNYDGKTSISAYNKLTLVDKVDLIYAWGTTPAVAVAPVAEKNKFPLITLTGQEAATGNKEYVIDFCGRISDFSTETLKYIRKKGFKNIAIVHIENQYIEALLKGMEENKLDFESIKILASFSPEGTPDFSSILNKLKLETQKNNFDALGVFLGIGQLSLFYQKMDQYKISIPTFGTDYLGDQDEMKKAGPASVNSFYATPKVTDEFVKKYSEKYKNTNIIAYAANMYDFTKLVYEIFKDVPMVKLNSLEILKRFEISKSVYGASGEFYFVKEDPAKYKHPSRRFVFPIIIKEVQANGASQEVGS